MKQNKLNKISYQDFGGFQTELLHVDYMTFNIKKVEDFQISGLARYFQSLGFNCYQKNRETNKSRTEVNNRNNSQNKYELTFILKIPYWNGIQVHFAGVNSKHFYELIKKKRIQWQQFDIILSRIDLYYDRRKQFTDKTDSQEFINSSFLEFQNYHSLKNLQVEKNKKGLIFKIGSRKSQKYYRLYPKDNSLRFEFEMKGNFIQDLQSLLLKQSFEKFEQMLAYQFFKHFFELFLSSPIFN